MVVVAPALVPLASAPPGVAFIDCSVKPPVNDGTRQVGHLVQLRTDAVPNLRPVGLSRRRNLRPRRLPLSRCRLRGVTGSASLVVATGSTGCVVGGPVAKTRMSGSGKSTATAMTGSSRFRFVGDGLQPKPQRVFVAGPDEHDDDGAVVPRLQERRA